MALKDQHLIIDSEFVICKICGREIDMVGNKHLKKYHNLILEEYRKTYPDEPTITKTKFEKELLSIENRKIGIKNNEIRTKEVPCYFHPDRIITVSINASKAGLCDECKSLGKILPWQEQAVENMKKTIKETLGVDNVSQLQEVVEKRRIKYENKSEEEKKEIVEKRTNTLIETFGDDWGKEVNKLSKKAMLEEYGVEHPLQNPESVAKFKKTFGDRTQEEKDESTRKGKITKLEKYGDENYNGADKTKETNLQKLGVDHHFKVQEKVIERDTGRLIRKGGNVLNYLKLVQFELLDPNYQGTQVLHNFKCLRCGYEFKKSWNQIQQGYVCPYCKPPIDLKCPYCNKEDFYQRHLVHLEKHGKTLEDLNSEFPEVEKTIKLYDLEDFGKTYGTEYQINKHFEEGKTKIARCWYDHIENCSHERIEVSIFEPYRYLCKKCESMGRENPDGRTKDQANERRKETVLLKTNGEYENVRQIPEVIQKTNETNLKNSGGTGFGGTDGNKSLETIKVKYKTDNVMKLDQFKKIIGLLSTKEANPERCLKISESLTGQPSKLKGRNYDEIHGPVKAKELIGNRVIAGVKGYKLSRRISKPQIRLFKLILSIWESSALDYEKNNRFLDIALGELKLDIEYDGSFHHNTENQIETDITRTEMLNQIGWKTIRFEDRVPSKEEIEAIIEDRMEEVFKENDNKLYDENSFKNDIKELSEKEDIPECYEKYLELGGKKDVMQFARHFCIFRKIMFNTYNKTNYDDLFRCWLVFEPDVEEAKRIEGSLLTSELSDEFCKILEIDSFEEVENI